MTLNLNRCRVQRDERRVRRLADDLRRGDAQLYLAEQHLRSRLGRTSGKDPE